MQQLPNGGGWKRHFRQVPQQRRFDITMENTTTTTEGMANYQHHLYCRYTGRDDIKADDKEEGGGEIQLQRSGLVSEEEERT